MSVSTLQSRPAFAWRSWGVIVLLLAAATLFAAWLDQEVSLTSQAMIYLLPVALVAYRYGWVESGHHVVLHYWLDQYLDAHGPGAI